MIERRSTIAALVAACMVTAFAAGSFAQQAAPPAVLVQPAELTPVADHWEFIGRAAVSPGNLVSPDSGVLATVVSETPIRVLFPVTQRELLEAKRDATAGDPPIVRLRLADGNFYTERGKLDFIDVTVDPKTDGQIVRATFDNKDGVLTDGQTVRVILEESKPQSVVAVPQQAVALDQSGPYLFVVDDKNVVELRRVKTGIVRNGMLVINEGLKAGDKVIIQGQQRVRQGMTVAPTVASTTPAKSKP